MTATETAATLSALEVPCPADDAAVDAAAQRALCGENLTAEQQAALAQSYQRFLWVREALEVTPRGARTARLRRELRRRESHVAALTASLERLVIKIVDDKARRRLGARWARQVRDDLVADGMVVMLEACKQFDPRRGPNLATWVARELRHHLSGLEPGSGGGTRPRQWRRVAAVAHGLRAAAALRGETLSYDDLQAQVLAEFSAETEASIRAKNPGAGDDEIARLVHDRLSRSSTLNAVASLADVLASSAGTYSLDAPVASSDGTTTYAEMLAGVTDDEELPADAVALNEILAGLPAVYLEAVREYCNDISYRDIAATLGVEWTDVKRMVRVGVARVNAPHAQFARFSASLARQFEDAPAPGGTQLLAGLAMRRERIAQG